MDMMEAAQVMLLKHYSALFDLCPTRRRLVAREDGNGIPAVPSIAWQGPLPTTLEHQPPRLHPSRETEGYLRPPPFLLLFCCISFVRAFSFQRLQQISLLLLSLPQSVSSDDLLRIRTSSLFHTLPHLDLFIAPQSLGRAISAPPVTS